MGNRAVITTKKNFENNGVGVYLHWNGGKDSVEAFLEYCKMQGFVPPERDDYGWACLTNVLTNYFGDGMSVGINTLDKLDCDNGDNGVYIIEDWKIIERKYFEGKEQNVYPFPEMIIDINNQMSEKMKFPKEIIKLNLENRGYEVTEDMFKEGGK